MQAIPLKLQALLISALVSLFVGARESYACGSMSHAVVFPILLKVLVLPALLLVPLELMLIKVLGQCTLQRSIHAYSFCLLAKGVALFLTVNFGIGMSAPGLDRSALIGNIIIIELFYSAVHMFVSMQVLARVSNFPRRSLWTLTAAISTVIPWLWSVGVYLLGLDALMRM